MVIIKSNGPLVAIGGQIVSGFRAHKGGTPAARLFATRISLDLDDISAQIPKQHRAIWPSQGFRQFDDSDPVEDHAHGKEL